MPRCEQSRVQMASSSAASAAPEEGAPKSMFSLPDVSMPDVTAPSPSQALVKAGDILTATISSISSKAGAALEVFGASYSRDLLHQEPGNAFDALTTCHRLSRLPSCLFGLCLLRALPQSEDQSVLP